MHRNKDEQGTRGIGANHKLATNRFTVELYSIDRRMVFVPNPGSQKTQTIGRTLCRRRQRFWLSACHTPQSAVNFTLFTTRVSAFLHQTLSSVFWVNCSFSVRRPYWKNQNTTSAQTSNTLRGPRPLALACCCFSCCCLSGGGERARW